MDGVLALLLGYALGSIPFGLLLARMAGKGDIRQVGSGNIGATNVLRTGSKWLAAAVLLLDLGKGFLTVWLASRLLPGAEPIAALGAVLGHCFPVWLGFKGGKGVATTAGACFALSWPIGLAYAGAWLAMLAASRISSLAGMSAAIAAPIAAAATGRVELVPVLAAIAVLVLWLHRENIARLRAGTEPKLGKKA
jgi:acyl phosphate:glycerol-3-phosphate acyltransferase